MKRAATTVAILSFLGILVTTYLVFQHYKDPGEAFCNVSDYVSCDIVNKSVYAEIFGIPVSALGFFAYCVLFIGALMLRSRAGLAASEGGVKKLTLTLTVFSGIGLIFSLILTYIEFFVLYALCIFCLTQQVLILLIFLILLRLCCTQKYFSRV